MITLPPGMQYLVSKNGAQTGPFPEAEVRQKLASGELRDSDLAWHDGLPEWRPLSALLHSDVTGIPPIPASAPLNPYSPPVSAAGAAPASAPDKTSGLAIASLVCGILGLFTACITSPFAVIFGHLSLSKIKKSGGIIKGRGMAIAGLVMGYALGSLVGLAILAALVVPAYNMMSIQTEQMKATSNCRQIIGLLHEFGADNGSLYPDSITDPSSGQVPMTSNEAFHVLFKAGFTTEEKIFGCPSSRYNADANIGTAPVFDQALLPGENHWAMTQGQTTTSSSIMPLVFENPVAASWPPQWNADAAGKPLRGRAWSGGKVIIGMNDGSVETIKLQAAQGASVGPRILGNGADMFTLASQNEPLKVLNIAVGSLPKAP